MKTPYQKTPYQIQTEHEAPSNDEDTISELFGGNQIQYQAGNQKPDKDEDITTEITDGDQIQLISYKSIPEFSGKEGTYRP